ncbi:hypothetical protein FSP39_014103 [Pinctada imbricata]|uniref:Methyltransferase domain-containing protein n=1 Tax=Pinctada imbricata TaxID=66713 RepID=A0AA89BS04_PINIB|nr:hypothetical protein FSP39_014103 [Pinctada imbricata]
MIKLLDFGCGGGCLSFAISDRFPDVSVTGVDIDDAVLVEPKRKVRKTSAKNLTFLTQTSEHLNESLIETFDIIIMNDVMHDLPDPVSILKQLKNILKPEGYLVTFDPDLHSNHRDNAGDIKVASRYLTSLFVCLPRSLSREPAAGLGMGWGYEKKIQFLEDQGFSVVNIDKDDKNDIPREMVVVKIRS